MTDEDCLKVFNAGGLRKVKLSPEDRAEYKLWKERKRNKERRQNPEYRKKEAVRVKRWAQANKALTSANTGTVRGILCRSCNVTIGHAKENIGRLKQLISYLIKYGARDA